MRNTTTAVTLLLLTACAGRQVENTGPTAQEMRPYVERPTEDGNVLVEIDLNSDGQADVYNYYRERTRRPDSSSRRRWT